jgi:hypothetical protein
MKVKILAVLMCFFLVQGYNAQRTNKITGNGQVVKVEKQVGNYNEISTTHVISVVLTDGKIGNLTIEAESNLIEYLDINTSGNTLRLTVKNGVNLNPKKEFIVYVPVTQNLRRISASGASAVIATKDFKFNNFTLKTSGASNARFKGVSATHFTVSISGAGKLLADKISAPNINFELSGAAEVKTEISGNNFALDVSGGSGAILSGKVDNFSGDFSGGTNADTEKMNAGNVIISASGASNVKVKALRTISLQASGASNIRYTGGAQITEQKTSGVAEIERF